MIINELITNAIKYAFDSTMEEKIITIDISYDQDRLIIIVSDNGSGANLHRLKQGFGYKLLESLIIYQLKGDFKAFNKNGLTYEISIDKEVIV